jgi:hypothetical protein
VAGGDVNLARRAEGVNSGRRDRHAPTQRGWERPPYFYFATESSIAVSCGAAAAEAFSTSG